MRLTGEMTTDKVPWELRLYGGATHNFTADPQNDDDRHANMESQIAAASFLKEVFGR